MCCLQHDGEPGYRPYLECGGVRALLLPWKCRFGTEIMDVGVNLWYIKYIQNVSMKEVTVWEEINIRKLQKTAF